MRSIIVDCLSDQEVLALVTGTLPTQRLGEVDAHLDGCADCRTLVAECARLEGAALPDPQDDPRTPGPGTQLGRYRLDRLVGRGGMGEVFEAWDAELERRVAIKLLRPDSADDEGRARLVREAKAMARLAHPNVVAVHEVGETAGRQYVVMEYVAGDTLATWLTRRQRSWREILLVFDQAAEGLRAAHNAGLVHRDFKPANVLMHPDGRACVSDFGLVRPLETSLSNDSPTEVGRGVDDDTETHLSGENLELTRTGAQLGTPAYMAPEQRDGRAVGPRADQFSFCVALHEALFEQHPFGDPRKSPAALLRAMAQGEVREPLKHRRVPGAVARALRRGLAADPVNRFPSMGDLLATLKPYTQTSRHRWLVASLGGLTVMAMLVAGWSLWPGGAANHSLDPPCATATAAWDRLWTKERRTAVHKAVSQPGWRKLLTQRLDDFGLGWKRARIEECRARATGDPARRALAGRRELCLEQLRLRAAKMLEALSRGRLRFGQAYGLVRRLRADLPTCAAAGATRVARPPQEKIAGWIKIQRWNAEATILKARGKLAEAQRVALRALTAAQHLRYAPAIAEARFTLGFVQTRWPDKAEPVLFKAYTEAQTAKHDAVAAHAAFQLAMLCIARSRWKEAIRWARMADATYARVGGNREADVWLLNIRSVALKNLQQPDRSHALAKQAATLADELQLPASERALLAAMEGRLLLERGRHDQARARLEGALTLALKGGSKGFEAVIHTYLGELDTVTFRPMQAITHYFKAARIQKRQGLHDNRARSLGRAAMLYAKLGFFDTAAHTLRPALDKPLSAKNTEEMTCALASFARLGRHGDRAIFRLRACLRLRTKLYPALHTKRVSAATELAEVLTAAGPKHHAAATLALEEALRMRHHAGLRAKRTWTLQLQLARLLRKSDPPRAHRLRQEARLGLGAPHSLKQKTTPN